MFARSSLADHLQGPERKADQVLRQAARPRELGEREADVDEEDGEEDDRPNREQPALQARSRFARRASARTIGSRPNGFATAAGGSRKRSTQRQNQSRATIVSARIRVAARNRAAARRSASVESRGAVVDDGLSNPAPMRLRQLEQPYLFQTCISLQRRS